ncbi:unnamed protein product [Amoebophrya sp. A120]|nr:unnamed protein product [Amoebophrya sp. A120]|eukprot:GSA120T00012522001.1
MTAGTVVVYLYLVSLSQLFRVSISETRNVLVSNLKADEIIETIPRSTTTHCRAIEKRTLSNPKPRKTNFIFLQKLFIAIMEDVSSCIQYRGRLVMVKILF